MADPIPQPTLYEIHAAASLPPGGKEEVGNKAWNLMRMAKAGLPVPAGFVLPTEWCRLHRAGMLDPDALRRTLDVGIARLEAANGLGFGAPRRPLLVSVRSGAAASMPGMMETVLDIGLNAQTIDGLTLHTGNPRLGWDSYRRLLIGFAEVVAGLPVAPFDALEAAALAEGDVASVNELDHASLRALVRAMLARYRELAGMGFPDEPREQLACAVLAVLQSWDAPKAAAYRRLNGIDDDAGTAVTVQTMVYGNADGLSGAGVGFTRNPATGAHEFYFDFQAGGQGEDVVAGRQVIGDALRLARVLPRVWAELQEACISLEALFRDAQDFEFTVQARRLFLLQTRRAKRTDWAALRIAVDLVSEGLMTPDEALASLDGVALDRIARSRFESPLPSPLAHAVVAGFGVTSGLIALDSEAVARMATDGEAVVLVRRDIATSDIDGLARSSGVLTALGGRTSHGAVVARQLDKVCLVSCPGLGIDLDRRTCRIGGQELREGEAISLDGNDGAVYRGAFAVVSEQPAKELATVAGWLKAAARETVQPSSRHPAGVKAATDRPARTPLPSRRQPGPSR